MTKRRRILTVTTWIIVVMWVVFHTVVLVRADHLPGPVAAVLQLAAPPLLLALAARFLLRQWWSVRARMSAMDPPARLLGAAVAMLPEGRREWGLAMLAELAEIEERSARWRFALSGARATLALPPAGGWPVLALVTGAAVAAVATVGPAVGAAVPGLQVFAMSFTGLVGAMVVLAVARSRRLRWPVPVPTVLVVGAVAGSIAATALLLRRDPAAAQHLPPAAAVYLAVVLAGCLGVAVASPRWMAGGRLAPHLGATGAVAFAAWFLLIMRAERGPEPPPALATVLGLVLVLVPFAAFAIPAFAASRGARSFRGGRVVRWFRGGEDARSSRGGRDAQPFRGGQDARSFRRGLQATFWAVTTMVPLTYAVWLPEALRRYAVDGRSLDGEAVVSGVNPADALIFCLGIFPVFGLAIGVVGAAFGARASGWRHRRA